IEQVLDQLGPTEKEVGTAAPVAPLDRTTQPHTPEQPVLRRAERRPESLGRQLLRAEISAAIGTEKNSKDLELIVEVVRCALARLEHDDACLRTRYAERADNAKPAVLGGVAREPCSDEAKI